MLSILIVGPFEIEIASSGPDLEVLRAQDSEEAIEKLARNRRIDAILLLAEVPAFSVIQQIREENPAPPPIFVAAGTRAVPAGAHPVPGDPVLALKRLLNHLE